MNDTLNVYVDSLRHARDSISAAINDSNLNELVFEPSKIISGDGILITVVGYLVVFISLLLLFIVFKYLAKTLQSNLRKKLSRSGEIKEGEVIETLSGEVSAAISMALYLHYSEEHDFENTVLTIKKVQRPYSPWSSKIYGLREYPKK